MYYYNNNNKNNRLQSQIKLGFLIKKREKVVKVLLAISTKEIKETVPLNSLFLLSRRYKNLKVFYILKTKVQGLRVSPQLSGVTYFSSVELCITFFQQSVTCLKFGIDQWNKVGRRDPAAKGWRLEIILFLIHNDISGTRSRIEKWIRKRFKG